MQLIVELLVFVLLVQYFFLLNLRSGKVRVSFEEMTDVLVDPAFHKLLHIVHIDIVFLQFDIWMTVIDTNHVIMRATLEARRV